MLDDEKIKIFKYASIILEKRAIGNIRPLLYNAGQNLDKTIRRAKLIKTIPLSPFKRRGNMMLDMATDKHMQIERIRNLYRKLYN